MAYGPSNSHVTDDVTWPPKVLRGSTVGYPSDSLASCTKGNISSDLLDMFCHAIYYGHHLRFDSTGNSTIRSADAENPTLEPNMKWIGSTVAEIWPFEYSKMAALAASECPDYKWRLNPVWHMMLYSICTHGNSGRQTVNGKLCTPIYQ